MVVGTWLFVCIFSFSRPSTLEGFFFWTVFFFDGCSLLFLRVSFLKKAVPSHIPVLYFTGLCASATTRRDVLSKVMCSLNSVRLPCFLPSRSPDRNRKSSAENC